nr:MAG TPA: hypothetical protein [Caudoviricetes sp.]
MSHKVRLLMILLIHFQKVQLMEVFELIGLLLAQLQFEIRELMLKFMD